MSTETKIAVAERLLTLRQIQEAAGVSRPTIYRWTHERGLKTIRVGGCVRVRESDWLAFLTKHTNIEGNGNES